MQGGAEMLIDIIYLCLDWEPHSVVLRAYSWILAWDHSWWCWGTVCSAGDGTRISHIQSEWFNPWIVSVAQVSVVQSVTWGPE